MQGDYQFSDAFHLILGGQAIKVEQVNLKWVPRLGVVVYQFSPNTGIKVLYGQQAYRSAFQLETAVDSVTIKGNPALAPETVSTLDLQIFHNTKDYQLSATYFRSQQQDLIARIRATTATGVQDVYTNQGETSFQGLELQGKWILVPHLFLIASTTYQTNESNGKEDYSTVPNWMCKFGVSYEFDKGSSIGLFNSWFSNAGDVAIKNPNVKYVNPEPDAFNLMTFNLNLNLEKWVGQSVTVDAFVYNVLDEDIYTSEFGRSRINSLPAKQGRGIYVGLQYKL